jgi:2-oxo-4-hydroxy-4-carboxy-5-ureidoimidazoline decarboxylase
MRVRAYCGTDSALVAPHMRTTMDEINAMSADGFTALLGGVYEHSPWIAAAAAERRPFADAEAMKNVMRGIVDSAPEADQLALIRAHPDLAGKLSRLGQLTPESAREQAAAGLDLMSPDEMARMTAANEAYRARFGIPFIVCARHHTKASILEAIDRRLAHGPATERAAALQEIHHIAQLRTDELICPEH